MVIDNSIYRFQTILFTSIYLYSLINDISVQSPGSSAMIMYYHTHARTHVTRVPAHVHVHQRKILFTFLLADTSYTHRLLSISCVSKRLKSAFAPLHQVPVYLSIDISLIRDEHSMQGSYEIIS